MSVLTTQSTALQLDEHWRLLFTAVDDSKATNRFRVALDRADGPNRPLAARSELLRILAALYKPARERLLTEILAAASSAPASVPVSAAALRELRTVLREPLPMWPVRPDDPEIATSLCIAAVDSRAFCVSADWSAPAPGWTAHVVSPEGERIAIPPPAAPRGRVTALVATACPSTAADGWLLELEHHGVARGEIPFPMVETHPEPVRRGLADAWASGAGETVVAAASSWRRRAAREAVGATAVFGQGRSHAEVGVLIDVDGGVEALEQHLCTVISDGLAEDVGLVYLLRATGAADDVLSKVADLHDLHGTSFEVMVVTPGVPFALARAAMSGRFGLFVLLSADLVPTHESWLGDLIAASGMVRGTGVVVPTLVELDGSIASAGWSLDSANALTPRLSGVSITSPAAQKAARVAGAGPGCMVVSAEAYGRAVAESPPFLGDEVDSFDVSLRLTANGGCNWYVPVGFYVAPAGRVARVELVDDYDTALFSRSWPQARVPALDPSGLRVRPPLDDNPRERPVRLIPLRP